MFKLTAAFLALLIGASALSFKNRGDDWSGEDFSEDDAQDVLDLIFCACDEEQYDGTLSLEEFTGPVCEAINLHLFGYQVNEDDFNFVDANGDGQISTDEVWNAINQVPAKKLNVKAVLRSFSDNVHVDAAVRVIGCACDNDGNMALSWCEVNSYECVLVQKWIFDHNLDEEGFAYVDANGDGEIDGEEAAAAIEGAIPKK